MLPTLKLQRRASRAGPGRNAEMPRKRRPPSIGPRSTPERDFLHALHSPTGLEPSRVETARRSISKLAICHVERELLKLTVDSAIGATLLAESLDDLTGRGVEYTRLVSKLRKDPDVCEPCSRAGWWLHSGANRGM